MAAAAAAAAARAAAASLLGCPLSLQLAAAAGSPPLRTLIAFKVVAVAEK